MTDNSPSAPPAPMITIETVYQAIRAADRPFVTAEDVAATIDADRDADATTETDQDEATTPDTSRDDGRIPAALDRLVDDGELDRTRIDGTAVWYPTTVADVTRDERIVVFPTRREIVADRPDQYTRAQLSQFAHLVDSSRTEPGTRGYLYRIRPEDVWAAPFETLEELLATVRSVLPRRSEHLEGWLEDQWERAHTFVLKSHPDGYTVLEAATESLMGNVARQKLTEEHLHAPISDTESWVREEAIGEIKRVLYEAGYPVVDDRDLETGDPIDVELTTGLRDYQQEWVDRFLDRKAGVFVGPPGSGKTVAAMGVLAAIGGETLILVPSRELADQWRTSLAEHTTIEEEDVGEYHGGQKDISPVTIATYQTAGMDRHRHLFDSRQWGLIVYDEVHHVPSAVFRRSTDLQTRHRLGLSASPVREDDRETEIFTLIGPPIGTDWSALTDAGFVAEPELEIRYVPWRDETAENAYVSADGRERARLAATNPAKIEEVRYLLSKHPDAKALVFVEYLEQGRAIAAAIDVPFLSGETPHPRRRSLLDRFRRGEDRTLVVSRVGDEGIDLPDAEVAIVASGLGGSRRQGTQRAGRTMRPAGNALVYVLATRGSREEDFARRQLSHLGKKGFRIRERTV